MQMAAKVTTVPDANEAILEALPQLLVGVDWQGILEGGTRAVIERQALGPFLQRQRWFASKSRQIKQARISDWAAIRQGTNPEFVCVTSVEYADGWTESYFVPLALLSGKDAERMLKEMPAAVLARITGARKGVIVDGVQDDSTCDEIFDLMNGTEEVGTARGAIRGVPGVVLDLPGDRRWTRGTGDQSNSLVFLGDQYVMKLFRRIEPGPNPELEVGRALAEQGFARTPTLTGALEYARPGLEHGTLGLVQTAVKHQGSGWEYTVDELRRYYERVVARVGRSESKDGLDLPVPPPLPAQPGQEGPPPFFAALENWYMTTASILGRRTAEMHLALSRAPGPAFAPEPLESLVLQALFDEMQTHAEASLQLLERRLSTLKDASRAQAEAVLASRIALLAQFEEMRTLEQAGARIRVHGDYHLGQVLRTEEDFVILDFEGEPGRSIVERRSKQSPLKDVAGMVRSYSYASYAALFAFTVHAPDTFAALESWADTWQHWAADAFLGGYKTAVGDAAIMPSDISRSALLRAFVLDKALYELGYELNNRPEWVLIPLIGIRKIIG
jgi:maltose alpha-D-glucosyltransferase/alpha-amylase